MEGESLQNPLEQLEGCGLTAERWLGSSCWGPTEARPEPCSPPSAAGRTSPAAPRSPARDRRTASTETPSSELLPPSPGSLRPAGGSSNQEPSEMIRQPNP